MTNPKELAARLLAEVESRHRPVVETRNPNGSVLFDIAKPSVSPERPDWQVVHWTSGKPGRPSSDVRGQKKLETAILRAIRKHSRQRSVRAITQNIIADRESAYYRKPYDTLYKRVNAAIKQRGLSFWHHFELCELLDGEPSVELLRELGLQSLDYLERPFGGWVVSN